MLNIRFVVFHEIGIGRFRAGASNLQSRQLGVMCYMRYEFYTRACILVCKQTRQSNTMTIECTMLHSESASVIYLCRISFHCFYTERGQTISKSSDNRERGGGISRRNVRGGPDVHRDSMSPKTWSHQRRSRYRRRRPRQRWRSHIRL
jgi:hypothetical protein